MSTVQEIAGLEPADGVELMKKLDVNTRTYNTTVTSAAQLLSMVSVNAVISPADRILAAEANDFSKGKEFIRVGKFVDHMVNMVPMSNRALWRGWSPVR